MYGWDMLGDEIQDSDNAFAAAASLWAFSTRKCSASRTGHKLVQQA